PIAPPLKANTTFPVAPPVPGRSKALEFNSTPDVLVRPGGSRRSRGRGWLTYAIVFVFFGGGLGAGIWVLLDYMPSDDTDDNRRFRKQANFQFTGAAGWKKDPKLLKELGVNLALRHKDPRSYMALTWRDYKSRLPTEGELLDRALRILKKRVKHVEYRDPFTGAKKGWTGKLGGQRAVVMEFSFVDRDEVPMNGQCYMLGYRGIGYWLLTWGAEDDREDLEAKWEDLRDGFQFLDDRAGWKPRPRATDRYAHPDA